jgi:putative peptide zinc metalloprotease protein
MPQPLPTFSESWHRVANQCLYLRTGVIVQRQSYRGQRWIVLRNPFSNQYFRLQPAAYEFVSRLRPELTVQEVWQQCLERFPDRAPGQEAVLQLLGQLYFANLLHYDAGFDSAQLFERFKKRRQREITGTLMNLMFIRFPLLDPDYFLVRTLPIVGKVINAFGALIWMLVVGWAIKVVMDNFPALRTQGQEILAPQNLPLLYGALILLKVVHEFGHAYFCRKFGGEVHVMGVLLMIFTPVPYMDATSSWGFRSRWKRVLVGAAGMIVEIFVAALATFLWASTSPGTLHNLAYNMMFIASVSTIVFNANPLLRFDGYYILSDLLEIPNLSQRASMELRHWWEHYVFGVQASESPARNRSEAAWLGVFGIASGIYRVIVFSGVLLLVADRFLILGIIMAAVCAISWITIPAGKFIHYLASSPRLERVRLRAISITCVLAAVLLVLLGVVPFPNHFRAPGVLEAGQRAEVLNDVPGLVVKMLAKPGSTVTPGQPLLLLTNQELDLDLADALARRNEIDARLRLALSGTNADLKPLQSQFASANQALEKLQADKSSLIVRARIGGQWVSPRLAESVGRTLARGAPLGLIINPGSFEFVATVTQADADAAFGQNPKNGQVRLRGQAAQMLPASHWLIVPGGQQMLPSAALGWAAGGPIAVSSREPERSTEPFFEVHAQLPMSNDIAMFHGRSGVIRFDLAPEPLLQRWVRALMQLLQKRYQI